MFMGILNGLLSIVAINARLAELLERIQRLTGATILVPPDVNEQVAVRLGPDPAAHVIATLLYGSRYNYVIAGSDTVPLGIASVTLTVEPPKPLDQLEPATTPVEPPAESKGLTRADLTGGDEGVWDNLDMPTRNPNSADKTAAEETESK
jgi:hypothetical protein